MFFDICSCRDRYPEFYQCHSDEYRHKVRELAMLESIGMTKRQIIKMLTLEGIYYAGFTMISSLLIGMLMSVTILRVLTHRSGL